MTNNKYIYSKASKGPRVCCGRFDTVTGRDKGRQSTLPDLTHVKRKHRPTAQSTLSSTHRVLFYLVSIAPILTAATASTTHRPHDVGDARSRLSSNPGDIAITPSVVPERSSLSSFRTTPQTSTTLYSPSSTTITITTASASPASSSSSSSSSQPTSPSSSLSSSPSRWSTPQTATTPSSKSSIMPELSSLTGTSSANTKMTPVEKSTLVATVPDPTTHLVVSTLVTPDIDDEDVKSRPGYLTTPQDFDFLYLKRQMDFQRREMRHVRFQLTQSSNQITNLQKALNEIRTDRHKDPIEQPTDPTQVPEEKTSTTSMHRHKDPIEQPTDPAQVQEEKTSTTSMHRHKDPIEQPTDPAQVQEEKTSTASMRRHKDPIEQPTDPAQVQEEKTSTTSTPSFSQGHEKKLTTLNRIWKTLLPFALFQKETGSSTNPNSRLTTSPNPVVQTDSSTEVTIKDKSGPPKKPSVQLDSSEIELKLFDLRKEFEFFQIQVNRTLGAILTKLASFEYHFRKGEDTVEHPERGPWLRVRNKHTRLSDEDEVVASREARRFDSGVMNDAFKHSLLSELKSRLKMAKGGGPQAEYIDPLASVRHEVSQSTLDGSVRKDRDEIASLTPKKQLFENGRPWEDELQELVNINDKVKLLSDSLENLETELSAIKAKTSESIKLVKESLRRNTSMENRAEQLKVESERKEVNHEGTPNRHSLSDHVTKEHKMADFKRENETRRKEKEYFSFQRKKDGNEVFDTSKATQDVAFGSDARKLSERLPLRVLEVDKVHHNFSWLVINVQTMQTKVSSLDDTLSELSTVLSRLSIRLPFDVRQRNKTTDDSDPVSTEKSTSDHLSRLLRHFPAKGQQEKTDEKRHLNKSAPKDDPPIIAYEAVAEPETNSSKYSTLQRFPPGNQTSDWKSGSQMISDSAEQLPGAAYDMLEALMAWIRGLEEQIQKIKINISDMKTKIIFMFSSFEELFKKEAKIDAQMVYDFKNQSLGAQIQNSRIPQRKQEDRNPQIESVPITTFSFTKQISSVSPMSYTPEIQERFTRKNSGPSFENSGTDTPDLTTPDLTTPDSTTHDSTTHDSTTHDSTTQSSQPPGFTELHNLKANVSKTLDLITKLNTTITEYSREAFPTLPTNILIPKPQTMTAGERGPLETVFEDVKDLVKRINRLEEKMADLNEEKINEANYSGLHVLMDYQGSGTTEEAAGVSIEILNKIKNEMTDMKKKLKEQEHQINLVKNNVFMLDENVAYLGKKLSVLDLKQRRDDRFYFSQGIVESNLSLTIVAEQVSQILIPEQQLTVERLKELNETLIKQWKVIKEVNETATRQRTEVTKMAKNGECSNDKILYVDLRKRKFRIYNSTSVINCSSMKDADQTFLNNKTQTCYYGYGNTKMLPYDQAKKKCEDSGLHLVFTETKEERDYVAKEITQEIGGHWIGVEKFKSGWYWVQGSNAVNRVMDPPWRYNHSVPYTRAIIWGDKWSGKFPTRFSRFVCEEEPFKEEICDGFQSFERIKELSSGEFFRSLNTLHKVDCGRLCLADPSCRSFRFRSNGHHKCALYNQGNTTMKEKIVCDDPREVCYKKMEHCYH